MADRLVTNRPRRQEEVRDLDAIDRAVRAAHPDRADRYIAVVERWLWWSGQRAEVPLRSARCVTCTRDGVATVTFCRAPLDQWDPRTPFHVCGACLVLTCELANQPLADTEVLAELKDALERPLVELVFAWRKDALPFAPSPTGTTCTECLGSEPPLWEFARPVGTLCEPCFRGVFHDEFGFALTDDPLETRILRRQYEASEYRRLHRA